LANLNFGRMLPGSTGFWQHPSFTSQTDRDTPRILRSLLPSIRPYNRILACANQRLMQINVITFAAPQNHACYDEDH